MYWNCKEQFNRIRCAFPMHQRSLSLQNLAPVCQQTFNQSFKSERSNIYCPPPASCFPCKPSNQPYPKACNIDENYMARCTREHIMQTLAQNAGERLKRELGEGKDLNSKNKRKNMKIKKGDINARIAKARLNEESSPSASPTSVSLLSSKSNIFSYSNEDNISYDANMYDVQKSDIFLNHNKPNKEELESDYVTTANIREEFDDYKVIHEDDLERGYDSTDAEEVLNEYEISCEKFPCNEENSLNNEGNQPDSENTNWPKICYFFGNKDFYPSTCCKSIQCNLTNACFCCKSKMNDLNRKDCCCKAVQCNNVNDACDDTDVKVFKMAYRAETDNAMNGHLKCKKEKALYCAKSDCNCPLNNSIAKDREGFHSQRFGGGAEVSSLHTIKSLLLSKELSLIGVTNKSNRSSTVFKDCLSEMEQKKTFSHSSSIFNSWLSDKVSDKNQLTANWWDQYFDILEDLLPIKKDYLREMCSNGNSNCYQCYDPCNNCCYTCCYTSNCANTMICVPKNSCCNYNRQREELCAEVPSCQRSCIPICCKKPPTACPLPISPKGELKSFLSSCPSYSVSKISKTNKSKDAKTKGKNGKKKSGGDTESLSEKVEDCKIEKDDDTLLDEAAKESSTKSEDEEKALQKEFETTIPRKSLNELDTVYKANVRAPSRHSVRRISQIEVRRRFSSEEIEPNGSNDRNRKSQNAFDFNNEIYRKQPSLTTDWDRSPRQSPRKSSEYFSAVDNGDDSDVTLKASNAPEKQYKLREEFDIPAYERGEQDEEEKYIEPYDIVPFDEDKKTTDYSPNAYSRLSRKSEMDKNVPRRSYYRSNSEYEREKHYSSEEEEFNEPNKLAPFDTNKENRRGTDYNFDDYTRSSRGFDIPQRRSYRHREVQYEKEREERYSSEEDGNGRDLDDEINWRQAPRSTPLEKNKFYTIDEDDYPKPNQRKDYEPHSAAQSPDLNTRGPFWNDSEYNRESPQNFNEGNNLEDRLYKGEINDDEYQRPSLRPRFVPMRRSTRRISEYRMNRTEEDAPNDNFLSEINKNNVNYNDVVGRHSIARRNTVDKSTQYEPESSYFKPNATRNDNEQNQTRDSKYYKQDGGRGSFRPSKIESSRMTNDDFSRMSVGKPNRMDEKVYNEPFPERTIYDDVNVGEKHNFVRPKGRKSHTMTTEYLIDENGDLIQHKTVATEEHEYNKVSSNKNQKVEDNIKDNGTFDSYKQSESAQLNPFQNDRKSLRQTVTIAKESDEGKAKANDERAGDTPRARSSRASVVAILGKETPPRHVSGDESRERHTTGDKRLNNMNSQEKFSTNRSPSTKRNSTSEKHPLRRLPNSEEKRYNKFLNSELEKVGKKLKSTKKRNSSSPILSKENKATKAKTSRLPEAKSSTTSFVAVLGNEIQPRNFEEVSERKLDAERDNPLNYTNSRERRDTQSKRGIIPNSMNAKPDLVRLPNNEEKRNSRFANNKSDVRESEIRKNTASSYLSEYNSNPEKRSVIKTSNESNSRKRQNAGADDEENVLNVSKYRNSSPQELNITQSPKPSYRRYSRYREYESEAETEQSGGTDENEFNRRGRRATSDSSRQSRRNTERYSRPTLNRKLLQFNDFDANNQRDTLRAADNQRYSRNYEPEVERYSSKYIPNFKEINDQEPRNTSRYSRPNEDRQSIRREFQPDTEQDVDLNRRSRQSTDRISRPSVNRSPSSYEGNNNNQQRYSSQINRHSDFKGENEMYQGVQRTSNNVSLNDTNSDLKRPSGRNTEQYLRASGNPNTLQNDDFDANNQINTLRKSDNQRYSGNYEPDKQRYSLKYIPDSERKSDDQQRYSGRMSRRESQSATETEGGNEVEKSGNLMLNNTNTDTRRRQDQSTQYMPQNGNRNTLQFGVANSQRDSIRKSGNQHYSQKYDPDTESIPDFEEINNQPLSYSRRHSRSSKERQSIRQEYQSNSPSDAESLSQARQTTEIYQPERERSFSANDRYFEGTNDNHSSRRIKSLSQRIKNREYVSDIQRNSWEEIFEGENVQKRISNNQSRRSNDFKIENENQLKVMPADITDYGSPQERGDKEPVSNENLRPKTSPEFPNTQNPCNLSREANDGSDAHQPYSEISNIPYFSNLCKEAKNEVLQGIHNIKSYCSELSPQRREMFLKNVNDLCPKGSNFKEIENYCNQLSKEQKESILKKLNQGKENSNETEEGASTSQEAKLRERLEKQGLLPGPVEFKTVNSEVSVRSENLNNGTVFTPNEVNHKDSHARNSEIPITSANRSEVPFLQHLLEIFINCVLR